MELPDNYALVEDDSYRVQPGDYFKLYGNYPVEVSCGGGLDNRTVANLKICYSTIKIYARAGKTGKRFPTDKPYPYGY